MSLADWLRDWFSDLAGCLAASPCGSKDQLMRPLTVKLVLRPEIRLKNEPMEVPNFEVPTTLLPIGSRAPVRPDLHIKSLDANPRSSRRCCHASPTCDMMRALEVRIGSQFQYDVDEPRQSCELTSLAKCLQLKAHS